jgi:hypothetical protein
MAKKPIEKIFRLVLSIILISFLLDCANQLPPTGGEVDTIPPEIVEAFPPNRTVNHTEGYFEISFSEYVDKRSVQDAIFISPAIEGEKDFEWTGKSLEVEFENPLKENTTYTITIGTDVIDINNRNKMEEAFSFAFSTGSEIDNGEVRGKVFDKDPSGVMIFAYKKDTVEIDPLKNKPDYISQVGKKGNYNLLGLAEGDYQIFAVRDDFRDLIYNIGEDYYGSPNREISLSKKDSIFFGLDFFLTKEDTSLPHLFSAVMTDKYHILIELSEFIDSSKIGASSFFIFDSTINQRFDIQYVFKGQSKSKQLFLALKDTIVNANEIYLTVNKLTDRAGNVLNTESTQITVSTKPDTLHTELLKMNTRYPGDMVDFENPQLWFNFNDGFNRDIITNGIKIKDKKNFSYPHKIKWLDDAAFILTTAGKLNPKSEYHIELDLNYFVDAAGNKIDSVHRVEFKTINDLVFSGVTGLVKTNIESFDQIVILESVDAKFKYEQKLDNNFNYKFEKIFPGKYFLWIFADEDTNGIYGYGSIVPFKTSERFVFYPDTLNLRARWPVGDVNVNFN